MTLDGTTISINSLSQLHIFFNNRDFKFPLVKPTCPSPSSTPPSCLHLHQPPSGKDELPVLGTGLTPYERLDPGAAPSLFLDSLLFFSVSSEKSTCPLHVCWLACRISFASHVHDAAFNLVTPCYLCPLPCMVEKRTRDIVPHLSSFSKHVSVLLGQRRCGAGVGAELRSAALLANADSALPSCCASSPPPSSSSSSSSSFLPSCALAQEGTAQYCTSQFS